MKISRGFASDNNAGVHPEVMAAMAEANRGHVVAYGDDPYTRSAISVIRETFGAGTEVFFVFLGTAANVLGLSAATKPFHSIICAESSHIHQDECGAPERFTGCKLLPVETPDGKIDVHRIKKHIHGIDFEHHSQPRVVSITQATELGTVYTPGEIRAIADFAHQNNMILHMDGARIANAAVNLNVNLKKTTRDAGVDILSFGGTKNGMMYGEAILFFNSSLTENFIYTRKQGMQLASKMRFIAVQFEALLKNDLWKRNAAHANAMATMLAGEIEGIPGLQITQKVQANGVFATIPQEWTPVLQKEFFFYEWDEETSEVRWMTSYDTQPEDVYRFAGLIRKLAGVAH